MDRKKRNYVIDITGINKDVDRDVLKKEFSKFGKITKIFIHHSGTFARVFFSSKESSEQAVEESKNSQHNWVVRVWNNSIQTSSNASQSSYPEYANMQDFEKGGDEYDLIDDFCNIHGHPLPVLQAENGEMYVSLKDVKKTGFAIFRKDSFDPLLVDKRQIGREFELYLLSEAKSYILKNRVASLDEDKILSTIERCKNRLLNNSVEEIQQNSNQLENKFGNFGQNRSIAKSQLNSSNLTITAVLNPNFNSTISPPPINQPAIPIQRPPRQPVSFMTGFLSQTSKGNRSASPKPHLQNGKNRNEIEVHRNLKSMPKTESAREQNGYGGFLKTLTELEKIQLNTGKNNNVRVVYKEPEKEGIFWVQRVQDFPKIENIFAETNKAALELENIKPVIGELVLADYDDTWNRGLVTKLEPVTVFFFDYGNTSPTKSVRTLPDKFKKDPCFAARVVVNNKQSLQENIDLNVFVKQMYDDGTYLVESVSNPPNLNSMPNSPIATKEKVAKIVKPAPKIEDEEPPSFFDVPEPLAKLKEGDRVVIEAFDGTSVYVKTRECVDKCKEINIYVKELDKTTLLLKTVKEGQVVLASKDGSIGMFRGVITKKENPLAVTLKYIDYAGEENLSIKSLRNIDEFLSKQPSCLIKNKHCKVLNDIGANGDEILNKIIENKEKLRAVVGENYLDFQLENGVLLSAKISEANNPKPKPAPEPKPEPQKPKTVEKPTKNPVKEIVEKPVEQKKEEPKLEPQNTKSHNRTDTTEKILFDGMDYVTVKPGLHNFICFSMKNYDELTLISLADENVDYLQQIFPLEVEDKVPYEPEQFEMCLAAYENPKENNSKNWYRAVVIENLDEKSLVLFVDFGNEEEIKFKDIRRYPTELKDVPILGLPCKLLGVPKTDKVLARLQELIQDNDIKDVIVKKTVDMKYEVEIPGVFEILKKEGLL